MNWRFLAVCCVAAAGPVHAQVPEPLVAPQRPAAPPVRPAEPRAAAPRPPEPPPQQMAAAQQQPPQQAPLLARAPQMFGDLPGYFSTAVFTNTYFLTDPLTQRLNQNPAANYAQVTEQYLIATLALSRGSFKIAENESPQPQDRVFVTYNYFQGVPQRPLDGAGQLTVLPQAAFFNTTGPGPFPLRNTLAGTVAGGAGPAATLTNLSVSSFDVHRETFGFEKTFFSGNASVGLRLPVFQSDPTASSSFNAAQVAGFTSAPTTARGLTSGTDFDSSRFGDASVVLKYAPFNDIAGGSALTAGLVVTTPTGGGISLANGDRLYSVLLQPFVGGLKTWDRLFVHGFSALAVGTDSRDVTLWFNDVGVGYFAYRADEGFITAIAPTAEAHLTTGLGDDRYAGTYANDILVFTGGVTVGFGRASLRAGAATPATGPRPFEVEGIVQFNWTY